MNTASPETSPNFKKREKREWKRTDHIRATNFKIMEKEEEGPLEFERFRCRRFVTLGEFFVVTDPGGGEEDTFLADDDGEGIWAIRNFGDDVEFFVAGVDF